MAEFAKAKLQRVTSDESAAPVGDPIEVQFNPNSLKLALANANDTGKTVGRQKAQYLGTGSATLSVELTFDTADEGTTEEPLSVLDRTTPVEQLLLPQGAEGQKQSPPTVRFEWGRFILTGLVESMNVDLDLFSDNGVPLRARVGLSIKEQRSDFEFMKKGPGANTGANAVAPGKAGPGAMGGIGLGASVGLSASASLGLGASVGGGIGLGGGVGIGIGASFSAGASVSMTAQTAVAIEGESAAEFAARVGVDPAAWRAVAAGQVDATLAMPAGAELDFEVGASAAAGLGATVGAQSGVAQSVETAFGLSAPSARTPSVAAAPGFKLAAAGGVAAAIETVNIVKADASVAGTRHAFGVSSELPTVTPARPDAPSQPRGALHRSGDQRAGAVAPSAPPPPQADRRAISFGAGVPLRPRVGGTSVERPRALYTVSPANGRTRAFSAAAPRADRERPSECGCGCGGHNRRRR